ncbi:MAG: peptide ABC transporter substrate-binding protein, partial [Pseudomonadota bacterium]
MKIRTTLLTSAALVALAPMASADGHQGERGRDGEVSIIYWQAPSTLNPFLSGGTKDVEAASLILEPLARFDSTGTITPWLATDIPTVENGGVSEDLTQITWTLRDDIVWSDGTPFTSEDVKFTWEYCTHPEGGCAQITKFEGIESVETPDATTVVVNFSEPKPYPYSAFTGGESPILQKAQFEACLGAAASTCTDQNFGPIGTGPFVVTEFRTNDVIAYEANDNYREEGKPAFSSVNFKGGGDADAAGRAVMQTGEFDYAWNLQLAPEVIAQMEAGGLGTPIAAFGPLVERIMLNNTNPDPALGPDERA